MIKFVEYFNGTILNLSGVMANPQYTHKCKWLERCEANRVRELWTFPTDREITHTELVERAHKMVALAREKGDIQAVWIRPLKSAPFFYTYIEDAFLTNGISVALPAEAYDETLVGKTKFRVDGWWVIPPLTEEELEYN